MQWHCVELSPVEDRESLGKRQEFQLLLPETAKKNNIWTTKVTAAFRLLNDCFSGYIGIGDTIRIRLFFYGCATAIVKLH
jgi:hypothetical protein